MTVKALVVDDSVVVRRTVANVLEAAEDVEVVATAADGRMGLRKIAETSPDVVTLDVEMPGMNGLETLREIRRLHPRLPVIMYSTLTERGAEATLEALELGAVDYATKPSGATTREGAADQVRTNLLPLVQLWGRRTLHRVVSPASTPAAGAVERRATITSTPNAFGTAPSARPGTGAAATSGAGASPATAGASTAPAAGVSTTAVAPVHGAVKLAVHPVAPIRALVIGVSTGGPDALARLLPMLPGNLPVPVAIVQHMPPVFTTMLAKRLNTAAALDVAEVQEPGDMYPGHVYLAPGGRHLEVEAARTGLRARLSDGAPENSCRPAVDVLFRSATAATGGQVLAVVLTGMGQDGLLGARLVRQAGGTVLAQNEATSVVWGMPGFVARDGVARAVLPLDELASAITQLVSAHAVSGPVSGASASPNAGVSTGSVPGARPVVARPSLAVAR